MTLADRIVVLDDGELQQIGDPKQIYHQPANRFVADFIGSPSMNFFEGTLETGRDGGGVFTNASFDYPLARSGASTATRERRGLDSPPGRRRGQVAASIESSRRHFRQTSRLVLEPQRSHSPRSGESSAASPPSRYASAASAESSS